MKTNDLHLYANQRPLVGSLEWQAQPGQCWCIIGRNGSGKSTLLKTLAGLHEPQRGSIQLHGRALHDWPVMELARQRAYLAQARSDAFNYRVIDIALAARHPHQDSGYWETDDDYELAYAALKEMDVHHLAERDIFSLSGGERQRVAIAGMLAQDTPVLLLDEPTNALDLAHQVSLGRLLKRLHSTQGRMILMATHDLNLARNVSSHALLLMGDGSWKAGPVEKIMTTSNLSLCLGSSIGIAEHGNRIIYFSEE